MNGLRQLARPIAMFAALSTLAFVDTQQRGEEARPTRKQVLAWADVRNGYQHDSIWHAVATIERLGRESGVYDTFIRTDSQLITKHPITFPPGTGIASGEQFNVRNLDQIKDFSRDKIRVLAHLDPSKLDLTRPLVHRTDGDFPAAWAKTYGKGRVFYSILGHDAESWDNPALAAMYFEAIRWALGLVEGNATPRR